MKRSRSIGGGPVKKMGTVVRGIRNLLRNAVRSVLVGLIIALAVAVFATMLQVGATTEEQADFLRSQVATTIVVTPPGRAIADPGYNFPETLAAEIAALPGVKRVDPYIRRPFADNTKRVKIGALVGLEPGALMRPATVAGVEVGLTARAPEIIAGRGLRPEDAGQPVAVAGQVFVQQYGLKVGDEFTIPAKRFVWMGGAPPPGVRDLTARVVGIFRIGVGFGDNQVYLPNEVLQAASGWKERVSMFYVSVASVDRVAAVARAIKARLGERVDLVVEQPNAELAAQTLGSVHTSSLATAAVAGLVGALVVLLTMALVVRERTVEVGTLKALGASHRQVALQFATEGLALALAGGIAGLGLALAAGPVFADLILGAAARIPEVPTAGFVPTAAVGAYALGLALLFGLFGSLYPALRAARLRPAEALARR
jgi:putative ABC transport system permease protein